MPKNVKDVTIYHKGIYYRRFIWVDGSVTGYHVYPSTPGIHYNRPPVRLWHNGLGSVGLKPTHTYR